MAQREGGPLGRSLSLDAARRGGGGENTLGLCRIYRSLPHDDVAALRKSRFRRMFFFASSGLASCW